MLAAVAQAVLAVFRDVLEAALGLLLLGEDDDAPNGVSAYEIARARRASPQISPACDRRR